MIKKFALAFLIAVALVVALILMQPGTYTVARSVVIGAPPATVFRQINDFHNWEGWSPWARIDPAMKQRYEGSQAGVGAVYKWSGNSQAGEGSMKIIESQPDDHAAIQLDFTRPYVSSAVIGLNLKPSGAGTAVTWTMDGKSNFALKAVSLFSSMDKMVGPDFERGLAQLKTRSEAAPR